MSFEPFVYGLVDPREPEHIRYVGMASAFSGRPRAHARLARYPETKPCHLINWVRRLQAEGIEYEILILRSLPVGTDAHTVGEVERMYISLLKRTGHNLTNTHDGGYGGRRWTKEQRFRKSIGQLGNTYHLGMRHSPETIRRMRVARYRWTEENPEDAKALSVRKSQSNKGNKYGVGSKHPSRVVSDEEKLRSKATKNGWSPETLRRMIDLYASRRASKVASNAAL